MRGWRRWRTERAGGPVRTGKTAGTAATGQGSGASGADRRAASDQAPRPALRPRAWREARADLPAFACLGVLVAVLAAVATAAPPLLDLAAGRALVDRIAAAQDERPLLTRTVTFGQPVTGPSGEGSTRLADDLEQAGHDVTTGSPDALDGLLGKPGHQVLVPAATLDAPRGTAALSLLHTTEAPGPAGYAAGRPPRDTGPDGPVEIAVSTRTRDALGLRLGQELALTPRVAQLDTPVVVTGFLRPDPAARLWRGNPLLAVPLPADRGPAEAQALIAPGALDALLARGLPQLTVEWRLRLEVAETDEDRDEAAARFAGDDGRAALIRGLAAYDRASADNFCATTGNPLCIYGSHHAERPTRTDEVQPLVRDFDAEWDQAATVVSLALASVVGVGLAAVLVTARLAVRRRLGEHRLRRARGASAPGVALSRAAQYAPVAGAALAAGYAGARLALPGGAAPSVWPAAAVAGAAWLALPALTWAAVRDRRPGPRRRRGSTGRRLTAEAAVLLLAGAGVWALRVRGTAGSGASDPLVAGAPLLCGLAVVVLLIRAYPPPLRLLARLAARRRGPLGLLVLSRAARDAPAAVLALLVLVATLGAAVFGGLVTGTVEEGRRDALEWRTGGADAVLTDAAGPAADEALRRAPGVAEAVRVRLVRTDLTSAVTGLGQRGADVLAVDGAALRRADPGSAAAAVAGLGAPRRDGAGRLVLPVLAGGERGEVRTGETYETEWPGVRVRVAGRLAGGAARDAAFGPLYGASGAAPGADRPLLLADTAALAAADRERAADTPRGTAAVLYYGTATPAALRAAAPGTGYGSPYGELLITAEERAADRDDGVLGAIRGAHAVCAALAAALALLTLLVELLLSAPERARTTAYLRLLGLGRRGATALGVLQLAPLALAAAAGGLVLGLALPAALGPALDLQALTGGPTAPSRHPDLLLTAALTLGLLALVAAAAAADAVTTRRTRRLTALRVGEDR
ncbi:hypothetical protein OG946_29260 [Streptomyces sp. NBC_01808]|uniref:FtsX-like permease family protein n=1 Tax=Streptomyces sp. NBC_01808 TaxID=2975947 RepID=UPI002DD84496|nr:FtsX-like permease family protein [Streptomyces sp. NBC_01808]WSA41109.1 hypothetical protein OG946_29260 [Streptomyces sp. NBC_01808]